MKRKLLMILALLTVSVITVPLSTIENGISNDTVSKPKISQSNENQEKTVSKEEKETDDQLEITESLSDDVKKISDEGDDNKTVKEATNEKKAAKKQAKLNKKPIAYAWIRLPASLPACFCVNRNSRIKNGI